jgi:CRISPR system Cascade subunit CasD
MCRAALGIGRYATTADSDFLLDLRMAIRLDGVSTILTDFHTVNPRDLRGYDDLDKIDDKKKRERQAVVTTGDGHVWMNFATLVTRRAYLQDSEFLWFIEGDGDVLDTLRSALEEPNWQLSLGRKACVPDWPMVLGVTDKPIEDAASWIPVVRRGQRFFRRNLEDTNDSERRTLHILGEAGLVVNLDRPLGNSTYNGYTTLTRKSLSVVVSSSVENRRELLEWVGENFQ